MADQESEMDEIRGQLNSMELRIRRLESALAYPDAHKIVSEGEQTRKIEEAVVSDTQTIEERGLESQIGRFGLAWMGNIVLLFGITFLTQYLMTPGHQLVAVIIGFIASASIWFLSEYLKKTNIHLAFMFKMNARFFCFI